jgi:ATP-dependent DNA helicase PIF1
VEYIQAGTGKSLILEHVKYHLWKARKRVAITAPTGIAAVQLGGSTIHSFSGVGLGDKGLREYLSMSRARKTGIGQKRTAWRETDVLVIDEISMLEPNLWEKLNGIAKGLREDDRFFGGMQIVVCGDFFQLPPVPVNDAMRRCKECGEKLPHKGLRKYLDETPPDVFTTIGINPKTWSRCGSCKHPWNEGLKYVFQTKSWNEAQFGTVVLSKVHRQQDQKWVDMLGKIKVGNVDNEVLDFLESLRRPLPEEINGVRPTRLYTHRADVQGENEAEFRRLEEQEFTFEAIDTGSIAPPTGGQGNVIKLDGAQLADNPYFKALQAPSTLKLKQKAQVMLLSNVDPSSGLVNGSRGIVSGFSEFAKKEELLAVGADGDRAILERYYDKYRDGKTNTLRLPKVKFANKGGSEGPELTVLPVRWSMQMTMADGAVQTLERIQIPLNLACMPPNSFHHKKTNKPPGAATVHKAQGLTLDLAAVDISSAFEPGQAYVGLSRCRSPEGMQILGFGGREQLKRAIRCCPIVVSFDRILQQKWRVQNMQRDGR